jgi:hypothetical protein
MDELSNCKVCGRVFQANELAKVCQNCTGQDESNYNKLRNYLIEHPRASIYDVATNLDISINRIKFYLREGRIEIVEKDNRFLLCEQCGQPIHSGRCCEECLHKHSTHDYKSVFVGNLNTKSIAKSSIPNKKSEFKINYFPKDRIR